MTRSRLAMRDTCSGVRSTMRCCVAGAWAAAMLLAPGRATTLRAAEFQDTTTAQSARTIAKPLQRPVTLEIKNVPLPDALRMIDEQADLGLAFTSKTVPANRRVSLSAKNMPAEEALRRVLAGTGISVVVTESGQVLLVRARIIHAPVPSKDSTGLAAVVVYVTDSATQKVIVGATVAIKGTAMTATTMDNGFALIRDVPSGLRTVTVRYFGYTPAEQQVVVPDSDYVQANFTLRMSMTRLQEVVTTATGTKRRYELGNDITILNVDSIVATQPISSVTDLLEGRVPGLTVQHTSGAPGDPSRLRLRGSSSLLRSNDPIVIVDGIRVYAAQSDSTSANLASARGGFHGGNPVAVPSPLDQIDPQSIATIEVMKGPSAATMYGPDAANGVIVITTKRGRSGPARWTASVTQGLTNMPGTWQEGIYRFGRDAFGNAQLCTLTANCPVVDSVVRFQALNNPRYSVLGQGSNTNAALGVSGGSEALTYALNGSFDREQGLLSLPDVEATRFELAHSAPPPSWMRRPEQLKRWSATSRLTAKINDRTDASLTSSLTRETQQRSSLETDLTDLMTTYIDRGTGTYWRSSAGLFGTTLELLPDFYTRSTDDASNFTNAANLTFRPMHWLTTSADAGVNIIGRQDEALLPAGLRANANDSTGHLNEAHASTVVSTVNVRATATAPLLWGFRLDFSTGANYTRTSLNTIGTGVTGLQPGTSSVNGASKIEFASQFASDITSFGWYVEPTFTHKRFTISTGIRVDGSSSFGSNVSLPVFPKVNGSWLLSEEPFFPFKKFFDVFRVRAAYGRAGVWPGPADQLRLYSSLRPWLDNGFTDITQISTIGNSHLRPERSSEMEGGFDADILQDRLSIDVTGYRKMRYDALLAVPVAPSVYGPGISQLENIGVIRNTGVELSLTTQLLRSDPATLSTTMSFSRNHNEVTRLAPGVLPFGRADSRIVAGYPLNGRWARPILGYADANGDGVIERSEVLLGDSLIFMGQSEPKYEANLFTTLSLLRGKVTVNAGFAYENGLTQVNNTIGASGQEIFSPGLSDPSSSFGQQAAVAVMDETEYGLIQTVNTFRFNSLSVAFNASPTFAARFGASSLSLALQGTNLALHSNYTGKDPNVNGVPIGNETIDTGVLPLPRSWQINVRATY